jgi:glyoxylase-like metal-dependent hydrolase (beta-lactamase superfamily II)
MVFLTHHHLDHAMNVGIFPNAKVVDQEAIYMQDKAEEGVEMLPDTDITILPTPGHESGHGILVVPTAQGTVVVAGDNFWWTTDEDQILDIEKKDDFAEDMSILVESRKKVLELANWVVPGHGKVFEVKK